MYPSRLSIILLILFVIWRANVSNAKNLDRSGYDASPKRWMVEFYTESTLQCLGALVNGYQDYDIVVRASCVMGYEKGEYRLDMRNHENTETFSRTIADISIHPHYQKNRRAYDLAVIKPSKKFDHKFAKPIPLANGKSMTDCDLYDLDIYDRMVGVTLKMVEFTKCKNMAKGVLAMEETFICASSDEDICSYIGYVAECKIHLIGISIDQGGFCGKTQPYVMYNMRMFASWISENKTGPGRSDAVTFRRINLYNIIYLIIIMLLSLLLKRIQ